MRWGSGAERGSFSPKLHRNGTIYNLFTVWNWAGEIDIQFQAMKHPPFVTLCVAVSLLISSSQCRARETFRTIKFGAPGRA